MNEIKPLVLLLIIAITQIVMGYYIVFKNIDKRISAYYLRLRAKVMLFFGIFLLLVSLVRLIGGVFFDVDTKTVNIYDEYNIR